MTQPLIVFPDTHGHLRHVETLLRYFKQGGYLDDHKIAFLGDLFDRGPNIRQLIDLCIDLQEQGHIFIRGNHEFVLEKVLSGGLHWRYWLKRWQWDYEKGTLESYGVRAPREISVEAWKAAALELRLAFPPEHLDFLRGLPYFYEDEQVVLVHAGLTLEAWDAQRVRLKNGFRNVARGPRQLFSSALARSMQIPVGKVVVSGHSLNRSPVTGLNRIMLNCGVELGGQLYTWVSSTGKFIRTSRR